MTARVTYIGEIQGDGPCVVLVPSLGRGGDDFDDLERRLNRAGYSTLAVTPVLDAHSGGQPFDDLAGVADAADMEERALWPLLGDAGQTFEDLATTVVDLVRQKLLRQKHPEPVHLIGHAYGQALSRCIVAGHPDFAKSLTLLACGGSSPSQELFTSVRACFDESLAIEDPDAHLQHVKRVFFAPAGDPSPWARGWLAEVARLQMEALLHTPATSWTSASITPTQVIQALQDELAPPQGGRDYVADHPEVALIELDGAGHAMLPEQPLAIAEAVIEFLRRAEELS